MIKLGFRGIKEDNYTESTDVQNILDFTVDSFGVMGTRGESSVHQVEISDQEVVEIEYENGIVDFITSEELIIRKNDKAVRGIDSLEGDDVIWINDTISVDNLDRGIREIAVKIIRIFKRKEKLAALTVDAIAKRVDSKNIEKEGLFYCEKQAVSLGKGFSKTTSAAEDGAYLLMIHGFASSSEQSFCGFSESQEGKTWTELWEMYPDRLLAYDHRSITKSPLQNAAELIDSLAPNMTLDVLSFSRGGLIAEILVKAAETIPDTESDQKFWSDFKSCFKDNEEDLKWIDKIINGIKQKKPVVRNLVRTACPAGGTSLASDRLVLYLKVLLNSIGLIPAVKAFRPYDHLKGFIIAIAQQKGNIKLVPGIEALDPKSSFIRGTTNIGSVHPISKTPLHVISGDNMFGGLIHTLKVIAADAFFLGKNDFVVDTLSMLQGFTRKIRTDGEEKTGFYFSFHRSKDVSHFNYFINQDSRNAIVSALSNQAEESPLFRLYTSSIDIESLRGFEYDKSKPTVIVIPGIMGSHLEVKKNRVWLDIPELVLGGIEKLKVDAENVDANGVVRMFYGRLCKYLSKSYNVIVHGFDWRLDLLKEEDKLKVLIEKEINRSERDKPIRIIAHSMGGLLVQALYSKHKSIWKQLEERAGFKTIFFGTPFGGSHAVINIYLKKHTFFNLLHSIDVTNNSDEVLHIINRYIGMLQLLPTEKNNGDFFDHKVWKSLQQASRLGDKFTLPAEKDLEKAVKWRELIKRDPIQGENLIYVAGYDNLTPVRVDFNDTLGAIKVIGTVRGDGTVPWETGITSAFSDDKVFYMDTKHQSLLNNKSSFSGIVDLLDKGTTKNAEFRNRPIESRGKLIEYEMPEVKYLAVNNEKDLQRVLMGDDDEDFSVAEAIDIIKIKVTHGDLGYSDNPVVVGHFEGDKLQGAEWAINKHLNGRLQENHDLGSYPGKIGESLAIPNHNGLFKGTLVVGLGYNERLTEKELERTCIRGLIELALRRSRDRVDSQEHSNQGISFLLVGSSYGGLDMLYSLRAIIRSVLKANSILLEQQINGIQTFSNVEFIELYEEKAIQINKSLFSLKSDAEFKSSIQVSDKVHIGIAGLVRITAEQETNWWHRLQITQEKRVVCDEEVEGKKTVNRVMKFASLSDKARAEVETLFTNKELIDILVSEAVGERFWDPVLSKTLYELLIPNEFKGYADDLRNIKIIVDKNTAMYPWEMLNHSIDAEEGPIVAQSGFIRQLYDSFYRPSTFYTQENRALIIADPIPTAPYQHLPGAREEGKLVVDVMKNVLVDFELEHSEADSGLEVCKKLLKHDYKIIHIAGHGEYDIKDPLNSGLILSNGIRLTPNEIKQMPTVPELVFINCCHLGKVDAEFEEFNLADRHKLAANFGTQFIRNGVKAVIAAGWAVSDKAAKDFARIFYKHMFKGDDFGTAIRYARKYCYEQNKDSNTWGAYQCYGNPHYRLVDRAGTKNNGSNPPVHKKEVVIKLENIARRADAISSRKSKEESMGRLTSRIDKILDELKPEWDNDSEILSAAGWAYFEIGNFEKTRTTYKILSETMSIDSSHRNRLNYLISLTSGLVDNPAYSSKDRKKFISRGDKIVELMLGISRHPEVLSNAGGHEKRKLHLVSDKELGGVLIKIVGYYHEAYMTSKNTGKGDALYALSNLIVMTELHYLNTHSRLHDPRTIKSWFKEELKNINDGTFSTANFWSIIHEADFEMIRLFVYSSYNDQKKKEGVELAFSIFKRAWDRGGSWRKLISIRQHYSTLEMVLEKSLAGWHEKKEEKHVEGLLKSLQLLLQRLKELE